MKATKEEKLLAKIYWEENVRKEGQTEKVGLPPQEPRAVILKKEGATAEKLTEDALDAMDGKRWSKALELLMDAMELDVFFIPAHLLHAAIRLWVPSACTKINFGIGDVMVLVHTVVEMGGKKGKDFVEKQHGTTSESRLLLLGMWARTVENNQEEAVRWYRMAAEKGNSLAQYNLGVCFHKGEGVPKNLEEALRWLRMAADQGHPVAQNSLGWFFQQGEGVPRNPEEAVRWFRMAAENGDGIAQVNLGWCLKKGEGVPKNQEEAVRWIRKATDQGLPEAHHSLGLCFLYGDGVMKDAEEAVRWIRVAALRGNTGARFSLGMCFLRGEGVPEDPVAAARWISMAAENGLAEAWRVLGGIHFTTRMKIEFTDNQQV